MPLRPAALLPRGSTSSLWACPSCLARIQSGHRVSPPLHRRTQRSQFPQRNRAESFHTSSRRTSRETPNHYDVLELSQTASTGDIKRQFYTLSKKHHPDHNPSDPNASTRFVAISEAYHVLSVPERRARYDAQLSQSSSRSHWGDTSHPQGSYSSASYAGSRPASGLNKKRSTFRGPPPSFYKSGGYGRHGAKRAEYASHQHAGNHAEQNTASAGPESYGGGFGFGPGQAGQGNEVPHFDDRKHKETHDHVYEHISARRRRERAEEIPQELDRSGMLANFVMVSGVVAIAAAVTSMLSSNEGSRKQAGG